MDKPLCLYLQKHICIRDQWWNDVADISVDGDLVWADSSSQTVLLLKKGSELAPLQFGIRCVRHIKFSPDGSFFVVITEKDIHIIDRNTRDTQTFNAGDKVYNMIISHDSTKMICEMKIGEEFCIWDLTTQKKLSTISTDGHGKPQRYIVPHSSMAFSLDDENLIECGRYHSDVRITQYLLCVWNIKTGSLLHFIDQHEDVFVILPTKKPQEFLVKPYGYPLKNLNVVTENFRPAFLQDIKRYTDCFSRVAVSRDGTMIAYSYKLRNDLEHGSLFLSTKRDGFIDLSLETEDRNIIVVSASTRSINAGLAFSRDGKLLYSFDGHYLSTWITDTYPFWTKVLHHTFPEDTKKCIKMILMVNCEIVGKKRRRPLINISKDVLLYIFSFFKRER